MNTIDCNVFNNMLTVLSEEHFKKPYIDTNCMGQEYYKNIINLCNIYEINPYRLMNNYMYYLQRHKRKSLTLNSLNIKNMNSYIQVYNKYVLVSKKQPPLNFYNNFLLRSIWEYFMLHDKDIDNIYKSQMSDFMLKPFSQDILNARKLLLNNGVPVVVAYTIIEGINKLNPRILLYNKDLYSFIIKFGKVPTNLIGGIHNQYNIPVCSTTYNSYINIHKILTNS